MALEGMQPTFKQVPPRAPRFSMQTVWGQKLVQVPFRSTRKNKAYLHAELGGLDSSDVATGATADDGEVIGASLRGEATDAEEAAGRSVRRSGVGEGAEEARRLLGQSCSVMVLEP
jgi:hypothetical protein